MKTLYTWLLYIASVILIGMAIKSNMDSKKQTDVVTKKLLQMNSNNLFIGALVAAGVATILFEMD